MHLVRRSVVVEVAARGVELVGFGRVTVQVRVVARLQGFCRDTHR
jgi:hypothetical protein